MRPFLFLDDPVIDLIVSVIAIATNIFLIGIFMARAKGLKRVEKAIGLALTVLAIPLGIASLHNLLGKREWWTFVLPLLMVIFLIVELLLDYILKIEFRRTRMLSPYLLLYYLALMGMIGYVFLVNETLGFINLGFYFLQLLTTWYSYRKVGHG